MTFRRTKHPILRALRPPDYDLLYALTVSRDGLYGRFGGETPSPDDFMKGMWAGVFVQQVAELGQQPIALFAAHGSNLRERIAHVSMAIIRSASDEIYRTSFYDFIEYLFDAWRLRKIYVDVPHDQREAFLTRGGAIFAEEACLQSHEFYAGQFWPRYTYALHRRAWEDHRSI